MSDYRINFKDTINAQDTFNLTQMLGIIDNDDTLTIIVDDKSTKDAEVILKLLYENGFECKTKGGSTNSSFYIVANRIDRRGFEGGIH
jgi:hypothetical protein